MNAMPQAAKDVPDSARGSRAPKWGVTLKSRMALGVAMLITGAVALSGWMYSRHMTEKFVESVAAQQAVIAERLSAEVAGKLEAQRSQIERFARDLPVASLADQADMAARLKALGQYHSYLDDFWAADASGRIVADYPEVGGRRGSSVADREYFRQARESGKSVLSEPTVGRFSGQGRVILFVPILAPDGRFAGAVAGVIRLQSQRILGELTRQKVGETGYVGVTTAKGVVLAHPKAERVMKTIPAGQIPAVDRMREGFEGTFEAVNHAGVAVVYTTRRIAGTDWYTYTAYPAMEAYGSMYRDQARVALLVLVLSLAGGAVAWIMMSRLLAPLATLEQEIRRIAEEPGKPRFIAGEEGDEIGTLARSFNDMLGARVQAETERQIAFEQIRRTGEMFEALHQRAPIGMALLRADGTFMRTNPAFQKITGYNDAELAQMREQDLTAPAFQSMDHDARVALDLTGTVMPYEKAYIARGGVEVPVRVSAVVVGDEVADKSVWWLVEDVTARRQMLDALRTSETEARMLSAAASHTSNMVVIADAQGRIEWVNEAFEKATGYRLAEVKGRTPGSLLHGPDTDVEAIATMQSAIEARQPFSIEVLNYARDGRAYWVAIDCTPVFDHLGRLERFVSVERDITSTRDLHDELKTSEEKHRRIFEAAREVIWEFDAKGGITLLNPAWERLTGYTIAETLGRCFVEFMVESQREGARRAIASINDGSAEEFDELGCFVTKSGESRWFEIRARTYRRAGGERFCVGSLHDVHDRRMAEASRRAAEEALRDSQERYARAIEGASDAIWERDLKTGKFYVSDRFGEMLRLGSEARPTTLDEVFGTVHPDDLASHRRYIESMIAGIETVTWESRFRTGDGGYRWLRVRGRAIRDADGTPTKTSGTASDVHDARAASEELRAMQVRYQRAMDGSNDGVFEHDLASGEFYFSDRFDEILGYAPGGMPRKHTEWQMLIHPEDKAMHQAGVADMLASSGAVMWEARFRSATGAYRWLRLRGIATRDVRGNPTTTSGTATDIHAARLANEELKRHRDNLAQLVEQRTVGLEAASHEAERQRIEAERARDEAEAARRQAVRANLAKSEFLANMSHELRTPMHSIISFANFGVEKIDRVEAAKLLHYFSNIKKSGSRLLSLLNDLLDLSKFEAGKMSMNRQRTDVAALIGEAIAEVEALARSRAIDVRLSVTGTAVASLDSMRMLQVLRNLLSNAIKFTPEGGEIRVACEAISAGDGAEAGLKLLVRDTGVGIPEQELETVFDKFVQSSKTKTGAGGTGLGLAICREIVAAHGGTIRASNNPQPETGATFHVWLPVTESARAAQAETSLN